MEVAGRTRCRSRQRRSPTQAAVEAAAAGRAAPLNFRKTIDLRRQQQIWCARHHLLDHSGAAALNFDLTRRTTAAGRHPHAVCSRAATTPRAATRWVQSELGWNRDVWRFQAGRDQQSRDRVSRPRSPARSEIMVRDTAGSGHEQPEPVAVAPGGNHPSGGCDLARQTARRSA